MAKVTYISEESSFDVDLELGYSLMSGAVQNGVPGIPAECGGAAVCGTCLILLDQEWMGRVPAPDELEAAMIEASDDTQPNMRLSCQIKMTKALDGAVIRIPRRS